MKRLLSAVLGCSVLFVLMAWAYAALPDSAVLGTDCEICLRLGGGPCADTFTPLVPALVGGNLVLAFFTAKAALAAKNFWRWLGAGCAVNVGLVVMFQICLG